MNLNNIYTEIITEHSRSKHNRHHIENPTEVTNGINPSCGDELTLEIRVKDDIIEDASFVGDGCAISMASASIMIDLIKGKPVEEARELAKLFMDMIHGKVTDDEALEPLEDAIALKDISHMPARVKCAVLSWHTLEETQKKQLIPG
ncbi:Fe-S cluster assembly sulfur transfer protein SufU [Scatolibacter rhodanostii]|uniref:Fe-S cluster assembly sulfur transfer protein SufU n=1 Tax=Scatolibacter rhodanostii TaxID=2014781 RepID=UPI000C07389B|nr:SUF system NifU family Fe-S cluster assembly protein [Scatolibacter rhodanostii]